MKRNLIAAAAAIAYIGSAASVAALDFTLNFNDGTVQSSNPSPTGSSGTAMFGFTDLAPNLVQLKLTVTNTTGIGGTFGTGATDSRLLAFFFDDVTDLTYNANSFATTGKLDNLVENENFQPFGNFSLGVCHAINNSGNCFGQQPNNGLAVSESSMATLEFTSTTTADVIGAVLRDAFQDGSAKAALRFQSVNGTGATSDKLLYIPPDGNTDINVPLPATLPLLLSAFAIFGYGFRNKRSA